MPVGIFRLIVALRYGAICRSLRNALCSGSHRVIPVESALDRIFGGDAKRLNVRLVHDQVGLVVTHVRAIMKTLAGHGMRQDSEQGFRKFLVIVGKILCQLAGSGVQGNAIARRHRSKESRGGVTNEDRVGQREVHIVKYHGDKSLRQHDGFAALYVRAR